ncbi:MAG TPA: zf-HC2 domain-containing protein [Terriglobales bacterium]|nr:zf-HC2 domain-containing protein [Terriglobales bacterium]
MKISLSCAEVRREISNYLDGDVTPSLRELIEAHLEQCQHCALLLDSTHNVLVLIADEKRFELPVGFGKRWRDRLQEEIEEVRRKS